MEIYPHSDGQVITLGPAERFPIRGADGRAVSARVVTTFEQQGYYTVSGRLLGDDRVERRVERELPDHFQDTGLLPPHVRDRVSMAPLDFGPTVTETSLETVRQIQRGQRPVADMAALRKAHDSSPRQVVP